MSGRDDSEEIRDEDLTAVLLSPVFDAEVIEGSIGMIETDPIYEKD